MTTGRVSRERRGHVLPYRLFDAKDTVTVARIDVRDRGAAQ